VDEGVHLIALDAAHMEPTHKAVVQVPATLAELEDEREDRRLVGAGLPRGGAHRAAIRKVRHHGGALLQGENVHACLSRRHSPCSPVGSVERATADVQPRDPGSSQIAGLFNDKLTIRLRNKGF
jgi:hypothetical protein